MAYLRAGDSFADSASSTHNGSAGRAMGIRTGDRRPLSGSGTSADSGAGVLESIGKDTLRRNGFGLLDGRSGAAATLVVPRQKAVRKSNSSSSQSSASRARNSDGASLQLMAHEVVFLRQEMKDLTDRERDVAFAVCTGGSNERMAERLCIALPTLRTHLMRLNQKLGTVRKGDIVRMLASRLLNAYRSGELCGGPAAAQLEESSNGEAHSD